MRLIDADRFKDGIISQSNTGRESYSTELICDFIDECPTAYDSGKVVEQLKENSFEQFMNECGNHVVLYLDDAIEIVRKGGAE